MNIDLAHGLVLGHCLSESDRKRLEQKCPRQLPKLQGCDFVLVPGPVKAVSFKELRKTDERRPWWQSHQWASEQVGAGWIAVLRGPYPGSMGEAPSRHHALVSATTDLVIPNMATLLWCALVAQHHRLPLFKGTHLCSSSVTPKGDIVTLSHRTVTGLGFHLAPQSQDLVLSSMGAAAVKFYN